MHSYIKFVKHILIVGSLDVLKVMQTLVFLPIITKILGVQDYGIWSQLKITMSLLVPFTFLGLHESLARFLPGAKDAKDTKEGIYSSSLVVLSVTIVLAFLLMIFAKPAASFFQFDVIYVKFLSLLVVFEALNTILFVVIRSLREIGKYFWFMLLRMFGETALVVLAIAFGYGLYGAVYAFLAIRIITFIALIFYVVGRIGVKIPDFSMIKHYLAFGLPTILDHISYWVITSVDRYFIGFMLGILFVGYYAPAYSIGTLLNFFLFPLSFMLSIVLPKLFDEGSIQEVKKYLSFSLKYFLLLMIPSVFGVSILSKQLLAIFSTQEIANQAFLVVPFVASSILFYGVSYFFSQILLLHKKTKIIALVWLIGAVVNFTLNVFFVAWFGILGAAITTLIAYVTALSFMRYFAVKNLVFEIDVKFITKSVISASLMTLIIFWLHPIGLLTVLASVILGMFVYGICMFLFKAIGKKEINFLKSIMLPLASA